MLFKFMLYKGQLYLNFQILKKNPYQDTQDLPF